jgi:cyanate permease
MVLAGIVFAHEGGGWDEALFVLVPLGVFAFLLWRAKKRAEAERQGD